MAAKGAEKVLVPRLEDWPLALAMESRDSGARIVVVGDANTALDLGMLDPPNRGMLEFPNRAFVMNATNWLLRREPLVSPGMLGLREHAVLSHGLVLTRFPYQTKM